MSTICFYHNADFDGKCSGAIVRLHETDVECYGINYGDTFPFDLCKGKHVVMVDFSLQPFGLMWQLDKLCFEQGTKFIWIDHHKSAIEEAQQNNFNPPGRRVIGKAACELCWEEFGETAEPLAVHLLGRYDVWDHSDPRTLPFQYGMRLSSMYPTDPRWYDVLSDVSGSSYLIQEILREGDTIQRYQRVQNKEYAYQRSFLIKIPYNDGHINGLACNKGLTNSQLFDSVYDPARHDVMVTFCRLPVNWDESGKARWTVSLHSTKDSIDCSKIAKQYGGGGHKGAAGFQCKHLPSWLF